LIEGEAKCLTGCVLIFVLGIVLLIGCRHQTPDDLPQLYSCQVKILCKNEPVADASVCITSPDTKWGAIGITGTDGNAIMKTNGIYAGVPAGTFKVSVTKYEVIDRGKDVPPEEKMLFDAAFATEETTPLECSIERKNNLLTFEVY
jgi:hypothetical protein